MGSSSRRAPFVLSLFSFETAMLVAWRGKWRLLSVGEGPTLDCGRNCSTSLTMLIGGD